MMMVLGLLPIVGSPLPIMSYGGSSMMAIMLGLGIAMSCKVYKDTPVNKEFKPILVKFDFINCLYNIQLVISL